MEQMRGKIKAIFQKYREQIMYLIFGGLTTIINWLVYVLLVAVGQDIEVTNVIAWLVAVLFAYVANRAFVFQCKATNKKEVFKEFVRFFGSRVATGIVEIVGFPVLYRIGLNQELLGIDGFLAKITVSVAVIILNYVCSKVIVFRKSGVKGR